MFGRNAWRIGRVGGIEIRIDPSWSFIAFLIAYTFYVILETEFPGESTGTTVVLSIVMAALFFGSVLLHELAHSWVAVSRGVEVRGITLFLFGGATHAELETETPSSEFVIAVVGPVTSLAIAGMLWAATLAIGDGPLAFATGRLGWINFALAVFNLVPGFPLDGGRLLRSAVWGRTGDLVRATRVASTAGQWVGYLLIAIGILEVFLLGALIGGLWLVAIGWFLSQSAQGSFHQLQVKRLLAEVPASRIMSHHLVGIPAAVTIQEAVDDYFMEHDFNAFPVNEDGETIGLVTLAAIRGVSRDEWDSTRVTDVSEPLSESCTVGPDDRLDEVVGKLMNGDLRRVVVVDDDRVIGIISPRDLGHWLERSQQLGLTETRLRR
ncbi:MAG: site-2 protease family protein [Halobacteriales archaeon]|nr:site-2 protease family protein [Halobacteriales archaeon]